jgi:ABC-type sugar transport system permease subunit
MLPRLILLALIATTLAACTTPCRASGWIEDRENSTIIHIKLFDLPDASRREPNIRADVAVVNKFRRKFPKIFAEKYLAKYRANPDIYGDHNWDNVQIQLHQYSGIKIGNLGGSIGAGNLLAVAGKVAPDVMYVNFRQSGTYIHEGFLYPLDKPEDGYLTGMTEQERAFRIHPSVDPVIRRKGPEGKEHVWALPYVRALGKVVLYRKDLFDEAGIPYPDNNWTWTDFLSICRKLTNPERGTYGVLMYRSVHEAAFLLPFLWSAGADVLAYDPGNDSWQAVFDSDEAAAALDFYTRICTEPWTDQQGRKRRGYSWRDAASGITKWTRGEIAMRFDYVDEQLFSTINPDVTGMVPVPLGPTGLRGSELNSRMMGLFAGIEERAVRDAAWEYIRFFESEEAVRIKTTIMVEGGLGRFINPRYLKMCGYNEVIRLSPRGWEETFTIALETGRPEPYARNCNSVYEIMTEPMTAAMELAMKEELPADEKERLALMKELLKKSTRKANEVMLGIVPRDVRLTRRITAGFVLTCMVIVFALMLKKVASAFMPPAVEGKKTVAWGFRKYTAAYLILLPAALTVFVWQYLPLGRGSLMAFQDYRIMGGSTWVWLDNFGNILWDSGWWQSIWNSLRYSFLVMFLTFLPPVILAILLQEIPRGKILFRTLFYLPAVMTSLVTILLWKSFYDPSERGVLNNVAMRIPAIVYLAAALGALAIAVIFARRLLRHNSRKSAFAFLTAGAIVCWTLVSIAKPILTRPDAPLLKRLFMTFPEPFRWLDDPNTAMLCCVLPMVWAGIGPGCLIYLAALKSIADDLYEVADIDGATFTDKILFVVFPMLKALLIINFVGIFIASWKATANILAMTGGASGTEVAGLHIFYESFVYLRFGPATAMAWMLGFMLIGFTVNQLRILSRMEFKAAGTTE